MSRRDKIIEVLKDSVMRDADKSGIVCSDFKWIEHQADALLGRYELMDKNEFCILRDHYGHDWHPFKNMCLVCGRARDAKEDGK